MNKKILFLITIGFFILAAVFLGFYFSKKKIFDNSPINGQARQNDSQLNQADASQSGNKLVTDDFEIMLTAGWVNTQALMGTLAMAVDSKENIKEPAAQKINFKSYLAVSHDTLSKKSLSEYMQTVKVSLRQTIPNAVFSNENNLEINGRLAYAMEVEMNQQEVDFKVLIIAVSGNEDDAWILSFNTLKDSWQSYTQNFSDMAQSFFIKLH
jgi:hypothetical protein